MKVLHSLSLLSLVALTLACNHAQQSNGCDDLGHGNCDTGGGSSHEHGHGKHGKSKGGKHGRRRSLQPQTRLENPEDDSSSLCADAATIGKLCMAGSSMGDRINEAAKKCEEGQPQVEVEVEDRRGRQNNKGKGGKGKAAIGKGGKRKCPSAEDIIEKIQNEMAERRCIMKEMGWVDEQGQISYQVEAAKEDLKSLNPAILENIDAEDIKDCQKKARTSMRKNIFTKKCKDKYSEEDRSKIGKILKEVVTGKCSSRAFIKSCSKYVANSFGEFVVQAMGPKEK